MVRTTLHDAPRGKMYRRPHRPRGRRSDAAGMHAGAPLRAAGSAGAAGLDPSAIATVAIGTATITIVPARRNARAGAWLASVLSRSRYAASHRAGAGQQSRP